MAHQNSKRILTSLQSILDQSIASGVPGVSAAIYTPQRGQCDLFAGCGNILAKTPVDKSSAFGVGSITKLFVAVIVLQLVQEEKLGLDDRAASVLESDILDGIKNAGDASIRGLLGHTSGILSWEDEVQWQMDGRGKNVQPGKIWEKSETLEYVRSTTTSSPTVGKYHYANTNYTILGLIIERITGNTAEGEIRRRILQPLGMEQTYFEGFEHPSSIHTPHRYHWATPTFRNTAGISQHYSQIRDDLVDVTGTNLSVSWTAGGMISTPSDLIKFAVALQNGRLLTPTSMATFMSWHDARETMDMGCGIFRLKDQSSSITWIGHNGGVLGFTGALWWDKDGTCAVSVLSNVGSSHAGNMPSNAAIIALETDFLKLAADLATSHESQPDLS